MSKIPGTTAQHHALIKLARVGLCAVAGYLVMAVIYGAFIQMYQAAGTSTQQQLVALAGTHPRTMAAVLPLTAAGAGLLIYWTIDVSWWTLSSVIRTVRTRVATQ
jgi:hypothetical protein